MIAKCYRPGCTFEMTVQNEHKIPKVCPVCGYSNSKADRQARLDKTEYAKKKDEGFTFINIARWIPEI